jgi:acyl carrier protein
VEEHANTTAARKAAPQRLLVLNVLELSQEECFTMAATNQTPATSALKDQIREFIQVQLAEPKGITTFTDDESLMESGVIDSLGIFRLVSFIEEELRVRISDDEINADTLKSVNTIEELVIRKRNK